MTKAEIILLVKQAELAAKLVKQGYSIRVANQLASKLVK
jgi:hypothetical protein